MDFKTVAVNAAKEAGKVILELSKDKIKYQKKSKHDILAEADLKSEESIISEIKRIFLTTLSFLKKKAKITMVLNIYGL